MIYTGSVLLESLHDESVLNFVDQKNEVKTEQGTRVTFSVRDELAPGVADEISRLLKPGQYASVKNEFDIYALFSNKVFHFSPKELEKRQKVFDYAKSLHIPESNLDF